MAQDSAARCSRSLICSTRSLERCNYSWIVEMKRVPNVGALFFPVRMPIEHIGLLNKVNRGRISRYLSVHGFRTSADIDRQAHRAASAQARGLRRTLRGGKRSAHLGATSGEHTLQERSLPDVLRQ